MNIGKDILTEAQDPTDAIIKGLAWKVLPHLEQTTDDVIDILTRIDKATGDWEKDGTLAKLDPKEKAALAQRFKAVQGKLDKIATMAEVFQREVLPRLAAKGAKP